MKKHLLLLLFIVAVQFAFSQNVRIIRASERTTVSNTVIIPTPARPAKTNDTAVAVRKTGNAATVKPSVKKNSSIKSVRGCCEKKSCVKKVCAVKKNPALPASGQPVESTKK